MNSFKVNQMKYEISRYFQYLQNGNRSIYQGPPSCKKGSFTLQLAAYTNTK